MSRISGLRPYLALASGFLLMLAMGTVYSYSVFRPQLQQQFSAGTAAGGIPYLVALASYAFTMMPAGRMAGRVSPRKRALAGGLMVAAGWWLSSLAVSLPQLTLTYGLLMGTGVGLAYGAPMEVAAGWFPQRPGLAVGVVLAGFGLSPLLTAPLAARLLETGGLASSFRALGTAFALAFVLLVPMLFPSGSRPVPPELAGPGLPPDRMVRSRPFRSLYMSFLLATAIGLSLIGLSAPLASTYTLPDFLPALSLFALFNGLGRPLFGWISDRFGPDRAMALSFGLILTASLLMTVAGSRPAVFLTAFCLYWMNLGAWLSMAPAATRRLFGSRHYTANYGIVFTAYGVGAVSGVTLSGILLDLTGSGALFPAIAILALAGLMSRLMPPDRHKTSQESQVPISG